MSLESILARGRRRTEDLMTDTCRITRPATEDDAEWVAQVIDEDTGQYPEQGRVTVYEGICRIQVKSDINSNVVETTAGEREWTYLTSTLQIPVETPASATGEVADVRPDNIAEVLTAEFDATLVGRLFNVQGIYHKSQATYRRWRIREVIS